NDVAQVAAHPQVAARGMILDVEDPVLGRLRVAGSPIKIAGRSEPSTRRPPPELDADRARILAELRDRGRR
ncbi:MAG: CoA transferase, partial [Alphaproteobacteria bacterium]